MNLSRKNIFTNKYIMITSLIAFIFIISISALLISNASGNAGITYRTHVAYNGWLDWKSDGATSGTTGESRRMEAIKIKLTGNMKGNVKYQTYVRGTGWQNEVSNGATSGTEGQSKQIEAIKIKLDGEVSTKYGITYRVHMKYKGWTAWVSDGAMAGSDTEALRIEAIEIKLVKKETTATGQTKFTTYTFTDYQLKSVAALCQQEQGTAKGAAAEASLMANHMDMNWCAAKKHPDTGEGLYNYVRTGKWFANAPKFMDDHSKLRPDVLEAVRKVLVEGKRTLPGYVNEHDCFSDITSAKNDGVAINKKDRGAYVKNKTIIKNGMGSTYTFYCFPNTNSDPFGYTSEEYRKKVGDFCYSFEDL